MKSKKWDKIKGEAAYHENSKNTSGEGKMTDTEKNVNGETEAENIKDAEEAVKASAAEEIKEEVAADETATEEKCGEKKKCKSKCKDKDKNEDVTITKEEVKEILDKFQELNDKYLHVVAEYDNYRKRAQKEKEGAYADAYADVLKEILPSVDNLERAVSFSDSAKIGEGVTMTLNQFSAALVKLGVESFGEAGEKFDPQIHNAVMHVEDESLEENVITDVFQKGYKKGDKIIRFAMVKVAN